jgi:hypothetical protein
MRPVHMLDEGTTARPLTLAHRACVETDARNVLIAAAALRSDPRYADLVQRMNPKTVGS